MAPLHGNISSWIFSQNNNPAIFSAGFVDEYQAVYDSFTTKPSAAIAAAQNTMVESLVASGVWAKLDVFYLLAQESNGDGEALKNWINPGTFNATAVDTPTFTSLEGIAGNGTSSYLNLNWNPSSNAINYSQNSASAFIYCRSNIAENKYDLGVVDGSDNKTLLRLRSSTNQVLYMLNTSITEQTANTDSSGLFIANRTAAAQSYMYRNGTQIGANTNASSGLPNGDVYALARNNLGAADFSTRQLSLIGMGSQLDSDDRTSLQNAIEELFFLDEYSSVMLTNDYQTYLERTDIDNEESNYLIGEVFNVYPRFTAISFTCGVPMSNEVYRRAFPAIYKFGNYVYLSYLAGYTHSPNALLPSILEIARSSDGGLTFETLPVKCVDDGGVMREIDPSTDGYYPYRPQLAYAGSRLFCIFPTIVLNPDPPVVASDYDPGNTRITYSDDNGETWSEATELDSTMYVFSSGKPIVVGSELWIPAYLPGSWYGVDHHTYILRYNVSTNLPGTKTQIDSAWTDLVTVEPAILEYATGKYMCVARVWRNDNYPGAETDHLGEVIAYSTDGLDWSNYTWHDAGDSANPNQPDLFKFDGHVYYSRDAQIIQGTVAVDESEIEWVQERTAGGYWYLDYITTFRQMYQTVDGVLIKRYDPRDGYTDQLRDIVPVGGTSFCVYDESSETLLAVRSWKLDGGVYIGEPWVSIVKRNSVGTGPTYNERLIYVAEIPGDSNTSNEMLIYNDYISEGDTVLAYWLDVTGKPTANINVTTFNRGIKFTSSSVVTSAKIVYEIIKA